MEQKKDSNRKRSPAAWFFRLIVLCCAAGLIIGLTNLWNIEPTVYGKTINPVAKIANAICYMAKMAITP